MFVKLLANRRQGAGDGTGQGLLFPREGCKLGGDWETEFCRGPGQCAAYRGLVMGGGRTGDAEHHRGTWSKL